MKYWCRLCRSWVYEEHFLLSTGKRDGCGQGRSDIRYHPENPLSGDLWLLADGRYLLVDYVNPFCTGFTFSDGERASYNYTIGFCRFLNRCEAILISTWEERPYPYCNERGWTRAEDCCTTEISLAFIRQVLESRSGDEDQIGT
jgi:hypothetical protein